MLLDDRQNNDSEELVAYVAEFWRRYTGSRSTGRVTPSRPASTVEEILREPFPGQAQSLQTIFQAIDRLVVPNAVKTSHPLFLGLVTPPSLDIAVLGDMIAGLLNQNVAFSYLSPVGTSIEEKVLEWLAEIVGYAGHSGGVIVSGGSMANLYGLAVARRWKLPEFVKNGSAGMSARHLRVYCSEQTHHSVHKAATLIGYGIQNVVQVPVNAKHQIDLKCLRDRIREDEKKKGCVPTAIVGNAGTRLCCAFDDLAALREIADESRVWLHVDAAYGGFLRIAEGSAPELASLPLADSVTIDPHKLLFVPFDCAAFLVQDPNALLRTFGTEGEYIDPLEPSATDFAQKGIELGRSMRAFKAWLVIKYFGLHNLRQEYTRLLQLAQYLATKVNEHPKMELLGPVNGTAVCFRSTHIPDNGTDGADSFNAQIQRRLLDEGIAFVDRTRCSNRAGFRVCMTNFRTQPSHLDELLASICRIAECLL